MVDARPAACASYAVFAFACSFFCKYKTHVCLLLPAVVHETVRPRSLYTNVVALCAPLKRSVLSFLCLAMPRCIASRNRFNA